MQAVVMGTLAGLADRRGDRQEARRLCQDALKIHGTTGNRLGEARDLGNLALLYESEEAWDQSLACLAQADSILADLGYRKERMVVALNRARLLERVGRVEEALVCAREAEGLAQLLGNSARLGEIQILLERLNTDGDRRAPTSLTGKGTS